MPANGSWRGHAGGELASDVLYCDVRVCVLARCSHDHGAQGRRATGPGGCPWTEPVDLSAWVSSDRYSAQFAVPCPAQGNCDWSVSVDANRPVARPRGRSKVKLPASVSGALPQEARDPEAAIQYGAGWLVGVDNGEFGG